MCEKQRSFHGLPLFLLFGDEFQDEDRIGFKDTKKLSLFSLKLLIIKEEFGKKCQVVIYNLLDNLKPQNLLRLEKGYANLTRTTFKRQRRHIPRHTFNLHSLHIFIATKHVPHRYFRGRLVVKMKTYFQVLFPVFKIVMIEFVNEISTYKSTE